MNRREHVLIGFGSALFIAFLFFPNLLIFTFGALVRSVFPDILEPATSYMHRSFFHSQPILLICIVFLIVFVGMSQFYPVLFFVAFFVWGYLSHLLADATTPMGLPG